MRRFHPSYQRAHRPLCDFRTNRSFLCGGWKCNRYNRFCEGEKVKEENELLHCVFGCGRFFSGTLWHPLRDYVFGWLAQIVEALLIYCVNIAGFMYDFDFLFGGGFGGSILGHPVSYGVFQERQN